MLSYRVMLDVPVQLVVFVSHLLGERGLALMSDRWRALQHVMLSPGKIGDIIQAVLVTADRVWCCRVSALVSG